MLSLKIAARFLKSSPGQSVLIMAGIAVGIATQIFVGSLITSLQADLVDSTVGSSAHITLRAPGGEGTVSSDIAGQAPKAEELISTAVAVRSLSAIYADGDTSVPLRIKAADAASLDTSTSSRKSSLMAHTVWVRTRYSSVRGLPRSTTPPPAMRSPSFSPTAPPGTSP